MVGMQLGEDGENYVSRLDMQLCCGSAKLLVRGEHATMHVGLTRAWLRENDWLGRSYLVCPKCFEVRVGQDFDAAQATKRPEPAPHGLGWVKCS